MAEGTAESSRVLIIHILITGPSYSLSSLTTRGKNQILYMISDLSDKFFGVMTIGP